MARTAEQLLSEQIGAIVIALAKVTSDLEVAQEKLAAAPKAPDA